MIRRLSLRFNTLFSKPKKKKIPQDLLEIATAIGPIIDDAARDIFLLHSRELIAEPITYIIPAVWGVSKEGALDTTQLEINRLLLPSINSVFDLLGLEDLSEPQLFAIGFLIRGYLISKITYLIESAKNQLDGLAVTSRHDDYMLHVKPIGTA